VVLAGDESRRRWIGWSAAIFTAPSGHVIVAWGPTVLSGAALLPAAVCMLSGVALRERTGAIAAGPDRSSGKQERRRNT